MIALTLEEIARATGGRRHGDGALVLDAVTTDSRAVPGGAPLFVALRGETSDGHAHAAAAAAAGALAALVEHRPDGLQAACVEVADTWRALRELARLVRERVDPRAVAITGSVGKTTVKDLTAAALRTQRRTVASVGSYNNELGVPLTLLALEADTQVLVAEIGARHVGDIAELAPLVAPDVAVVTAVAGAHLEIFGSIDAIARAKGELVEALPPHGLAVLNADDARVRAMAATAPSVLTYGLGPGADVTAADVTLDRWARPRFTARTPWGAVELTVPAAGRHQVGNALAALAVAGHLGVDLNAAAEGIAAAVISRWRGEVRAVDGVTVLNDAYNANPTSVLAALDTLRTLARDGRAVAVLGVMAELGPTHTEDHQRVGAAVAAAEVGHLVVVGDEARAIADGARDHLGDEVVVVPDAAAAVAHLRGRLAAGDVVLVKASRVAGLERVADGLLGGQETTT